MSKAVEEIGEILTREKRWFRSNTLRIDDTYLPSANTLSVNRKERVIYGFAVVTKGEAEGHNMLLNDKFLDDIVLQGNQSNIGIKSRFGHPSLSGEALGTAIGRAKSFRRDGDIVRADLHLLDSASHTPDGDLADYIMRLADEDPQAFGASIVFTGRATPQLNEEGKPDYDKPRIAHLDRFLDVDVVDDPAANPGGMFSRESGGDHLAVRVTAFLDRYFEGRLKNLQLINGGNKMEETKTVDPRVAELEAELSKEREKTRKMEEEARKNQITAKLSGVKIPALRPYLEAIYSNVEFGKPVSLTVDGGKPEAMSIEGAIDKMVEKINTLSTGMLSETATSPDSRPEKVDISDPDKEVNRRVNELMEKKKVDYSAALDEVLLEDPELKEAYLFRRK